MCSLSRTVTTITDSRDGNVSTITAVISDEGVTVVRLLRPLLLLLRPLEAATAVRGSSS